MVVFSYKLPASIIQRPISCYLAVSPLNFLHAEPVYPEDCYCPLEDVSEWMSTAGCSVQSQLPQIHNDLIPFKKVDFNDVIKEAKDRYHQPAARSFCHYVIKDSEVRSGK